LRIERPEAGIAVVVPSSSLDGERLYAELEAGLTALIADGVTGIVVDLSDFAMLDSAGLGALVAGHREVVGAQGARMVLTGVVPALRQTLSRAMLLQVLPVYDTLARALAAVRG
jgi:anti-anti-sigma factor